MLSCHILIHMFGYLENLLVLIERDFSVGLFVLFIYSMWIRAWHIWLPEGFLNRIKQQRIRGIHPPMKRISTHTAVNTQKAKKVRLYYCHSSQSHNEAYFFSKKCLSGVRNMTVVYIRSVGQNSRSIEFVSFYELSFF